MEQSWNAAIQQTIAHFSLTIRWTDGYGVSNGLFVLKFIQPVFILQELCAANSRIPSTHCQTNSGLASYKAANRNTLVCIHSSVYLNTRCLWQRTGGMKNAQTDKEKTRKNPQVTINQPAMPPNAQLVKILYNWLALVVIEY